MFEFEHRRQRRMLVWRCLFFRRYTNKIKANPISASRTAITAKIIIATMEIASAFNHPQSKKCFTKASQIISWIKEASQPHPAKKAPKSVPITVPKITIQMASVNFALSFPASALPESQKTGDSIMVFTMTWITKASKLTRFLSPFYSWFSAKKLKLFGCNPISFHTLAGYMQVRILARPKIIRETFSSQIIQKSHWEKTLQNDCVRRHGILQQMWFLHERSKWWLCMPEMRKCGSF